MTWLLESFWPAITLGVVLELVLAIVLVRTGRGLAIVGMVAVLVVTVGLVALERYVVTEQEEIENSLSAAEVALERNDVAAVLALFTPASPRRSEVAKVLSRFKVRDAHIGRDLEIRVSALTSPPSAHAFFTGRVEGSDTRAEVPYEQVIRKFAVTLHRSDGRWLIHDYEMSDPFSRKR
jgi:hypothetical protein